KHYSTTIYGYPVYYPWLDSADASDDYAVANLGEAKFLFSFDLQKDTDHDGIPDWWEFYRGLNIYDPSDAPLDWDGDGLSALREFQVDTDPRDIDTDHDWINDGDELTLHTSPSNPDTDGDALWDGYELEIGFDPLDAADGNADADGDHLSYAW